LPQNQRERWSAPARYYWELCERARKIDPRFVSGAASTAEINRLEKVVGQLEAQANEKAAKEQRKEPINIARGELYGLWKRAHEARQKIVGLEGKLKLYRREFAIIGARRNWWSPH
jgi:hypothetical protein